MIGDDCNLVNVSFFIEDSGNEIIIGKGTTVYGETHIAACEGRKIQIGEDCMFSQKIYLSTTDSHSVVTLSGERVNPAQDIKIGNHVWVGRQNTILKGSNIGNNVIVAASSLVSAHTSSEDNIVVGGTPAKVLCKERNWLRKRI